MDLLAKLGFDGRGFSAGLNSVIGQAKTASTKISGFFSKPFLGGFLGVIGLGSLAQFGKHIVNRAGEIKDLSEQFEISTDEVQRLQHAASQAGLSFEDFGRALRSVGEARKSAAEGNDKLREEFERYGIALEDLQNPALRDIDLLQRLGRALAGVNLTSAQRADLRDLLGGRGGDRLAAVFDKLADKHFTPMRKQDIEALDAGKKALERLRDETVNLVSRPAGRLAMILTGAERPHKTGDTLLPVPGAIAGGPEKNILFPEGEERKLIEYGEQLGRLRESELALAFEALEPASQLVELERQILDIEKERAMLPKESTEWAKLGTEANQKRIQLLGLQRHAQPMMIQTDDLARVGGYAQGTAHPADWQIRLVTAAERTAQNTNPE